MKTRLDQLAVCLHYTDRLRLQGTLRYDNFLCRRWGARRWGARVSFVPRPFRNPASLKIVIGTSSYGQG